MARRSARILTRYFAQYRLLELNRLRVIQRAILRLCASRSIITGARQHSHVHRRQIESLRAIIPARISVLVLLNRLFRASSHELRGGEQRVLRHAGKLRDVPELNSVQILGLVQARAGNLRVGGEAESD